MTGTGPKSMTADGLVKLLIRVLARYKAGEIDSTTAYQKAYVISGALKGFPKAKAQEEWRPEFIFEDFLRIYRGQPPIHDLSNITFEYAYVPPGEDYEPEDEQEVSHDNNNNHGPEYFRSLLLDVLERQRWGEIDNRAAYRESYIIKAIINGLNRVGYNKSRQTYLMVLPSADNGMEPFVVYHGGAPIRKLIPANKEAGRFMAKDAIPSSCSS